MKKWLALLVVVFAGLVVLPDSMEACGRRRCRIRACVPGYWQDSCAVVVETPLPLVRTVAINGKSYRIYDSGDPGDYEADVPDLTPPGLAAGTTIPASERFHGTVRALTKTTIAVNAQNKTFDSVTALHDSLPSDEQMASLGISHAPDSKRVKQELFNVTVRAWIYAFKKETNDNDYHVIIGDAPGTPNAHYFNAEVSGIPVPGTDANRNTLWDVRRSFQKNFELGASGPANYFPPAPPVPVRITGSLFWDVEHSPPKPLVGPGKFKPTLAWEIHPISHIEFLE